jgi:hypothetical protein
MRDLADLFFTAIVIISIIACYHRLSVLSHRIDMIIMVQQSQQKYIDKLMENKE